MHPQQLLPYAAAAAQMTNPQQMGTQQLSVANTHQGMFQQPNGMQQGLQTGGFTFPSNQYQGMAPQILPTGFQVPTHPYTGAQSTPYFPGQQQQQPQNQFMPFQAHHQQMHSIVQNPGSNGHTQQSSMKVKHTFDKKTTKLLNNLAQAMSMLNSGNINGNSPGNNPGNNPVNNLNSNGSQKLNQNCPNNGIVGQTPTTPQ